MLIIYIIILSTITFATATQSYTKTGKVLGVNEQVPAAANLEQSSQAAQVKMTATVAGWYEVEEIDNENIHVKTNMKVWVNGREFIRCDDCDQSKLDPSLLEF